MNLLCQKIDFLQRHQKSRQNSSMRTSSFSISSCYAYIPFTFIQKAPLVIFVVFCSFFLNLNAFVQLTSQVNAKKA